MRCCIIPIAAHRPTRLRRTGTIPSTASIFLTQRDQRVSPDAWGRSGLTTFGPGVGMCSSLAAKRTHGDTSIGSFPTTGEGSGRLMRRQRRRSFHYGDALLHRLLHLLEGTHAYLAHALGRAAIAGPAASG